MHSGVRSNREKYAQWVKKRENVHVFAQPWWLDIVCGGEDNWDVSLLEKNGEIIYAVPYWRRRRFGIIFKIKPEATPYTSPVADTTLKLESIFGTDAWIRFVRGLKTNGISSHHFRPEMNEILPWVWSGFTVIPGITLRLDLRSQSEEYLWKSFSSHIRRKISRNVEEIQVSRSDDLDRIISLLRSSYNDKGKVYPIDNKRLYLIHEALYRHQKGVSFVTTASGRDLSAATLVKDQGICWILLHGTLRDKMYPYQNYSLIWEIIKYCIQEQLLLDFEGSTIRGIYEFYRSFKGEQTIYMKVEYKGLAGKLYGNLKWILNCIKP